MDIMSHEIVVVLYLAAVALMVAGFFFFVFSKRVNRKLFWRGRNTTNGPRLQNSEYAARDAFKNLKSLREARLSQGTNE